VGGKGQPTSGKVGRSMGMHDWAKVRFYVPAHITITLLFFVLKVLSLMNKGNKTNLFQLKNKKENNKF
jgi:hypothetical protein